MRNYIAEPQYKTIATSLQVFPALYIHGHGRFRLARELLHFLKLYLVYDCPYVTGVTPSLLCYDATRLPRLP